MTGTGHWRRWPISAWSGACWSRPNSGAVRTARSHGKSWAEIATRLGVTRQSAWERWRDLDEAPSAPVESPSEGALRAEAEAAAAVVTQAARDRRRRSSTVVPNVVGMTWGKAREVLFDKGLVAVGSDPDGPPPTALGWPGASGHRPESGVRGEGAYRLIGDPVGRARRRLRSTRAAPSEAHAREQHAAWSTKPATRPSADRRATSSPQLGPLDRRLSVGDGPRWYSCATTARDLPPYRRAVVEPSVKVRGNPFVHGVFVDAVDESGRTAVNTHSMMRYAIGAAALLAVAALSGCGSSSPDVVRAPTTTPPTSSSAAPSSSSPSSPSSSSTAHPKLTLTPATGLHDKQIRPGDGDAGSAPARRCR